MIGVYCQEHEKIIAKEFFELFKTPWEFGVRSRTYDVVISTIPDHLTTEARLMVFYSSQPTQFDLKAGIQIKQSLTNRWINLDGTDLPIYGKLADLESRGTRLLSNRSGEAVATVEICEPTRKIFRIGYDLFSEVAFLLMEGQPIDNAMIPSIDLHISLLRGWFVMAGIPFVEAPPIPYKYKFFTCLTHDVDFAGIRRHKLDRTMWGFLYRSVIGSLITLFTGRSDFGTLMKNWFAALKMPLVFMGIVEDFWERFDDYVIMDKGSLSTFFLIPIKHQAGERIDDHSHPERAARYDISDVEPQVQHILNSGSEIGLHGIDAWCNLEKSTQEMDRIFKATKQKKLGIRMHWLYYNLETPLILDKAGFEYDATLGYNERIGFRNGSLQVFRPIGVTRLLELPLTIQDSTMFYPRRLNLTKKEARKYCVQLLEAAARLGGVITLSWHERSLKPERLWGDFYSWLLGEVRNQNAWIGNAQQIVEWFRKRRAIKFRKTELKDNFLHIEIESAKPTQAPDLFLRIRVPSRISETLISEHEFQDIEIPWNGQEFIKIQLWKENS